MRLPSTGKAILIILGIVFVLFVLPFVPSMIVWGAIIVLAAAALYVFWLICVRVNRRATGRSRGRF